MEAGDAFDRGHSPGQDLVRGQHGHNAQNGDGLDDAVPPPPQEAPSVRRDLSFYDDSPPSSLRKKKNKKNKSKTKHKGPTMTTAAKESSGSGSGIGIGIGGYKWSVERFIGGRVMRATDEVKADSWDGATAPPRLRVSAVSASDPTMLASSSASGASGSGISNPQQRITPSYVEACTAGVEDEMKVMVQQMLMDAEQRRQKRAEKQAAKEREPSKNRERKDGKDKIKDKDKDKDKKEQRVKRSASAFGLFGPGGGARRKVHHLKRSERRMCPRKRIPRSTDRFQPRYPLPNSSIVQNRRAAWELPCEQ